MPASTLEEGSEEFADDAEGDGGGDIGAETGDEVAGTKGEAGLMVAESAPAEVDEDGAQAERNRGDLGDGEKQVAGAGVDEKKDQPDGDECREEREKPADLVYQVEHSTRESGDGECDHGFPGGGKGVCGKRRLRS